MLMKCNKTIKIVAGGAFKQLFESCCLPMNDPECQHINEEELSDSEIAAIAVGAVGGSACWV